jgi:hypothetical protein
MIIGVQIIGIIFGLFMVYLSFLHYKRKEFNKLQFLIWEIIWICFLFIAFFPNIISGVTKKLGFIRVMDFLTITGFIFIALLTFYNYSSLNKIKKSLEQKVRKEALSDLDK